MTSDLIELRPRYEKETIKQLSQYYSVTVGGGLVKEDSDEFDRAKKKDKMRAKEILRWLRPDEPSIEKIVR